MFVDQCIVHYNLHVLDLLLSEILGSFLSERASNLELTPSRKPYRLLSVCVNRARL